jgi:hypothetical protein
MTINPKVYGVLTFYAIISIFTAFIGGLIKGKEGFSAGYIIGVIISVILWFIVGSKMMD